MNRSKQHQGGRSQGSFKGRANKTHKKNMTQPLRGGWRL